ncbi:helix-turn-helix domain-containing protein [Phytohabitans sp. ZYX-F-186]|uniref:Helix-turn-helix domain-containing protein n=1 Tax=Phytohabitans maris TaxID=3071409 RepID=A0ABU0ZQX5_9ACTN|nr:helix-turn-helix domain-containing protein [Phytohabitans sp. ZYX-F-186]MDQ7909436.1 helix-turn-helix domain-containing protein [Phytohabitans sp. ZYX-F-186]
MTEHPPTERPPTGHPPTGHPPADRRPEPRIDEPSCRTFQDSLDLVGRRWTGAILLAAERGARRFRDYRAAVTGISDRLLAQRLKELEQDGLLERTVIPSTPVQIMYALSPEGQELMSVLRPLVDWSYRRHLRAAGAPR